LATSHILEIGPEQATQTGGSVKAEGLGDGEWANHRQAALDDATQSSRTWDEADVFDGFLVACSPYRRGVGSLLMGESSSRRE